MKKPTSIEGLKKLLDEIKADKDKFYRENVSAPVKKLEAELLKKNEIFLKAYYEKIHTVQQEIFDRKNAAAAISKIDSRIIDWVRYDYSAGVDFGYNGLSVRYVDPGATFLILTNNGGTAGTGTAMGTGAYYYANADHFVCFPVLGGYMARNEFGGNYHFKIEGGRLTNDRKNSLITQAQEFINLHDIKPFEKFVAILQPKKKPK